MQESQNKGKEYCKRLIENIKVNGLLRLIDRRQQSRRLKKHTPKNKGRVIESYRKRKFLAQNFQKVGILFLQKTPKHPNGGPQWASTITSYHG